MGIDILESNPHAPRVAIIGSGISGLCMGIRLKRAGIDSFTLYEKSDRLGGTWRDNTYPGAGCDVPSFLYCYSFEPKPDWTRKFSEQPEILRYLEHCAEKYGLLPHLRFNTEIMAARFDEETATWHLVTGDGEEITADALVTGTGQLHLPSYPEIPGRETFRGTAFHSARWNHEHDLTGETVGVIGNGASAVQFVPRIAPRVGKLTVFQRSPNWIIDKPDREYRGWEHGLFRRLPLIAKAYRFFIYLRMEARWPAFIKNSFFSRKFTQLAEDERHRQLEDPQLDEVLRPEYPIGCKRVLISNDFFPALKRDNVEVVTRPITEITEDGVMTGDGESRRFDTLIYATGFKSTSFLAPIEIEGPDGQRLADIWKQGAEAYLGMSVPGFPNLFMLYGPSTNLGHNSIIFMIECQVRYIARCIAELQKSDLAYLDLDPDAMRRYYDDIDRGLEKTVWSAGCDSWYKNESGRVVNNWPRSTLSYWWVTRRPDFGLYRRKARQST